VASEARHVLAADIGGTNTRLALLAGGERVAERRAASAESETLEAILADFLDSCGRPPLAAACLGVAGPVFDEPVALTNLPWTLERAALCAVLGTERLRFVNDLEATAFGMLHLSSDSFEVLQAGTRQRGVGPVLVPAAGTGFGLAVLDWDGQGHHPRATESGHPGFAPRSDREMALLRRLQNQYGRVSLERIVSGPGLVAIHDFLCDEAGGAPAAEIGAAADPSAEITRRALAGEDPRCEDALALFCECYGAAIGDAALAQLPLGGIWIGGGIAPKILPALRKGPFLAALLDKGRFRTLLGSLHVAVCLEPDTALHGACALALRDALAD